MRNKIYKLWNKVRISKPFFALPSLDTQKKYADTLQSFFKQNSEENRSTLHKEWIENGNELVKDILNENPINFIDWKTIRQTMFHISKEVEFFEVQRSPLWKKYKHALRESKVGNPPVYNLYRTSSGNLIHHFYNLVQLLNKFSIEINSLKKVVEFGGGYGSTCRLIYNMGFSGNYTIFDIKEFLALQRYYLSMLNLYKKYPIKLTPDLSNELADADLCVMTWSLSEVPISLRQNFLQHIGKPTYFLIAYQKNFGSVDNIEYFKKFKTQFSDYTWFEYEIPHLKSNYYLVGKRNVANN